MSVSREDEAKPKWGTREILYTTNRINLYHLLLCLDNRIREQCLLLLVVACFGRIYLCKVSRGATNEQKKLAWEYDAAFIWNHTISAGIWKSDSSERVV